MSNLEMQKSFSSSSCQQRLMQKVRQLSAAALWSKSFNPLHLSSLPPPLSLLSLPLQSASLAFLLLLLFVLPLVHILLGLTCWSDANRLLLSLWSCLFPRQHHPPPAKPLQQILHLPNQRNRPRSAAWQNATS